MTFPLVPLRCPMVIIAPNKDVLYLTYADKILTSDGIVRRHSKKRVRAWMRSHIELHNTKSDV